jgi:hypothetical protein
MVMREGAALELPHILLIDDPQRTVVESVGLKLQELYGSS